MVDQARRQLRRVPRRAADEEDVALEAFHSFCRAARAGRYPDLQDRHGLWRLLLALTINKAIDLVNHAERDKRAWRRTALFSELDRADRGSRNQGPGHNVSRPAARPRFHRSGRRSNAMAAPPAQDEQLREIALLKLEGRTNPEIALQLQCAISTVERRLRLIRVRLERHWTEQDRVLRRCAAASMGRAP